MEQHSHPLLTIGIALTTGITAGVVSVQEIDIYLAIALKIVSIVSFVIASAYALWKWRADIQNTKIVNEVMNDYQERKQKTKTKKAVKKNG